MSKMITHDSTSRFSSTSWSCLIVQALPLFVIYPIRSISNWFIVAFPRVTLFNLGLGRFQSLLVALSIMTLFNLFIFPLIAVLLKWIIIGKYKTGRYPLWSTMYLKNWLVEQIINIMGKGIYRDDIPFVGPKLTAIYYRLMGAKIGTNVRIHRDAKLGQFDLLCIDDNVAIDNAYIRPYSLEQGHFSFLPIHIESDCSICVMSIIAPGTTISKGTCIGPLSSSFELQYAKPSNRKYCRTTFMPPPFWMILFIGIPTLVMVTVLSLCPWYYTLHLMVYNAMYYGWYSPSLSNVLDWLLWWVKPQRLMYYFILHIIFRCVVPLVRIVIVILIKQIFIGKFVSLNEDEKKNSWNRLRFWLMARLIGGPDLGGVLQIVGSHYEIISIIYRCLGATVGERIMWPHSGIDIVEFDLLEVGDDVIFGSKIVLMTSSSSTSNKILIEAGAMVSDGCVLLPGTVLRRSSMLAPGTLANENFEADTGSIWIGSSDGNPIMLHPGDKEFETTDTINPFGQAHYLRNTSYFVYPSYFIFCYNFIWQSFCACYKNCFFAFSLVISDYFLEFNQIQQVTYFELFKITIFVIAPLHAMISILGIAIDISSKWLIIGRRKTGNFSWNKSSYCQRSQVYLTIKEISKGDRPKIGYLDLITGSQYLVWFYRLLGCRIGEDVCLYPNGSETMMTEPDLCGIGDEASIDDAAINPHSNARGLFKLGHIHISSSVVLKSMTRVTINTNIASSSILLEHSYPRTNISQGSVCQGWPSVSLTSIEEYRAKVQLKLDEYVRIDNSKAKSGFNIFKSIKKKISGHSRLYHSLSSSDMDESHKDYNDNGEIAIELTQMAEIEASGNVNDTRKSTAIVEITPLLAASASSPIYRNIANDLK